MGWVGLRYVRFDFAHAFSFSCKDIDSDVQSIKRTPCIEAFRAPDQTENRGGSVYGKIRIHHTGGPRNKRLGGQAGCRRGGGGGGILPTTRQSNETGQTTTTTADKRKSVRSACRLTEANECSHVPPPPLPRPRPRVHPDITPTLPPKKLTTRKEKKPRYLADTHSDSSSIVFSCLPAPFPLHRCTS